MWTPVTGLKELEYVFEKLACLHFAWHNHPLNLSVGAECGPVISEICCCLWVGFACNGAQRTSCISALPGLFWGLEQVGVSCNPKPYLSAL